MGILLGVFLENSKFRNGGVSSLYPFGVAVSRLENLLDVASLVVELKAVANVYTSCYFPESVLRGLLRQIKPGRPFLVRPRFALNHVSVQANRLHGLVVVNLGVAG